MIREVYALTRVVDHPGFFHVERLHSGHNGDCPVISDLDGLPCWRFRIGVAIRAGAVTWFEAATLDEAAVRAVFAFEAGRHAFVGVDAFARPCEVCGVSAYHHDLPFTLAVKAEPPSPEPPAPEPAK